MDKLNLGCGNDILEGFVNADIITREGVFYCDINKTFPFKDNSFDFIMMKGILEEAKDVNFTLQEVNRILKKGGILHLNVPYILSSVKNTEMKRFDYNLFSCSNKVLGSMDKLEEGDFRTLSVDYEYTRYGKYVPFKDFFRKAINNIAHRIIFVVEKI